ncbi:hypothetical protein KM924_23270 [Brevibacillus parabrevis]|uniref:hypothetical protein n=1 Tax=Brevibacillus parabrevis TaxID=54914 RepID=UPI001C212C1F|nr:hypothetical protein [Brevibacillus parabrevis]MBU8715426.1 hypothetical protein [Brevibacillus parabrevis]
MLSRRIQEIASVVFRKIGPNKYTVEKCRGNDLVHYPATYTEAFVMPYAAVVPDVVIDQDVEVTA